MKRFFFALVGSLAAICAGAQDTTNPQVVLETSKGTIVIELDPVKAPGTVTNFLAYVEAGFYDGTIFHRVMPNFMVQGGGFDASMAKKPTNAAIQNEADNGLKNAKYTVAMARTGDPHSATAQFFINHVDNDFLNHTGKNPRGWGYTVFGHVIEGSENVDSIAAVKTGVKNGKRDVPIETVTIVSAKVRKPAASE